MYRNEQVCKKLKAKHGLYFAGGKEQVKQHRLKEPDNRMVPRIEWEKCVLHPNDSLVVIKAACGG